MEQRLEKALVSPSALIRPRIHAVQELVLSFIPALHLLIERFWELFCNYNEDVRCPFCDEIKAHQLPPALIEELYRPKKLYQRSQIHRKWKFLFNLIYYLRRKIFKILQSYELKSSGDKFLCKIACKLLPVVSF